MQKNTGADQSKLYIFSDGSKEDSSEGDLQRVREVRELIRSRPWCGQMEIFESSSNRGLADSIREGVTSMLQSHDRVIVLEDDLETSRGFLTYMNNALNTYSRQEKVYQVSGFMVPLKVRRGLPPTGFFRAPASWGWGTWARAWSHYNHDPSFLLAQIKKGDVRHFDIDGAYPHFDALSRNASGELRTWAVRWYASIYLQGGLCLYPDQSLVRNIGFDGSGINCGEDKTRLYARQKIAGGKHVQELQCIDETQEFALAFAEYYRWRFAPARPTAIRRTMSYLKRKLQAVMS